MAARAALVSSLRRLYSPANLPANLPAKIIPRRFLSSAGDHHGPPKINLWEDPLSPSKWKEEHLVLASLGGWGVVLFGSYNYFSGGKKDEVAAPSSQ